MQIGIHFRRDVLMYQPNPMRFLIELCEELEDLGYDFFENGDHLAHTFDGPTVMAAIVSSTSQLRLHTSIFHLIPRGLLPMAKFYASVDVLSKGRVSAGVGLGSEYHDWDLMGIPRQEMAPRFEEAVQALRALLRPGSDPFRGKYYNTEGIHLVPQPFQMGGVPVHIGTWGNEVGLRRAARLADGWRGSSRTGRSNPRRFAADIAKVEGYLREYGRDPATFSHGVSNVGLFISEDKQELETWGGPPFTIQRADQGRPSLKQPERSDDDLPYEHAMVGTPDDCIEKLRRWRESGCQAMSFAPYGPDMLEQLRIFAREIMPAMPKTTPGPKVVEGAGASEQRLR